MYQIRTNMIFAFFFIFMQANCLTFKCNVNPLNPVACLNNTPNIACFFSQFENKCIEDILTNEGCQINLNINSCRRQLTDTHNNYVKCIFDTRCREVNAYHLQNLGCNNNFSKYACLSVQRYDCVWDKQCIEKYDVYYNNETCETIYGLPVTPSLCAKIPEFPCFNGGIEQDFQCISMTEMMLDKINCDQPGLNEKACLIIEKKDQFCIFQNQQCKQIDTNNIDSCIYKLNRLGCLSITTKKLKCQWHQEQCQEFYYTDNLLCNEIKEVNINVCKDSSELCKYNANKHNCIQVTLKEITEYKCQEIGLSKLACLQIKNYYCTFENGYCQEVDQNFIQYYKCDMQINEDICLSIANESQYCKWNEQQQLCQSIQVTQDDECEKNSLDNKVNGNVCQAISKVNEYCKYNINTNRCINSNEFDECETPFLNINGCQNINSPNQICQWINNSCKQILIVQYETKCDNVKFSNPQACSQILESDSLGCYFNKVSKQCETVYFTFSPDQNYEQYQLYLKSQQIINQIGCNDLQNGINRTLCSSILTEGFACRWFNDACIQVKYKSYISKFSCIELQYSNSQTCAMVEFGKEVCRYFAQGRGCTNSIVKNMQCDELGLNYIGCTIAQGGCYFDSIINKCQGINLNSSQQSPLYSDILNKLDCIKNTPSKDICKAILTKSQLCSWSFRQNSCMEAKVILNMKCQDFQGQLIQVNANVCASIVMSFPDYDDFAFKKDSSKYVDENRGYCAYDPNTANCIIRTTPCNSNCCTDNADIGINQHVCSRFSIQADNIYCYFDQQRCQELTPLTVDTSNPVSVSQFYNAKQFKCTQMNKISCHMIDWSSKQLCYYNEKVCLNVDTKDFDDFSIFTVPPAIVNKYLCYSIEGVITDKNKFKYFKYNQDKKLCDVIDQKIITKYNNCEEVDGNMNYCLRYTENLNCKWDRVNLKCITINENEIQEIKTCTYDQNIKVCKENAYAACQFSYDLDKCINSPQNVNCNSFLLTGPVSVKACQAITQFGQMCEFQNYTCITTNKSSDQCDVQGTNSNACYNNTKGNCRWDIKTLTCYENFAPIQELKCSDNLNKILCSKIQKEPCVWDQNLLLCVYSNGISFSTYLNLNPSDISEWACTLITGNAVYYDKINKSCQALDSSKKNYNCTDLQMNNYACLLFTQGHNCYFDQNIEIPQNKCQIFENEQSVCTTKYKINIEICMNIPQTCYFSKLYLQCVSVQISTVQTCSQLKNDNQTDTKYYNKLSCSSIDIDIKQTDNTKQCESNQECNYEKFCYWNIITYTCELMIFQNYWYDFNNYNKTQQPFIQYSKLCDDQQQENNYCSNYVTTPENLQSNYTLQGKSDYLYCTQRKCNLTGKICSSDSDCEIVTIQNAQILINNIKIEGIQQQQQCTSYCSYQQENIDNSLFCPDQTIYIQEIIQPEKLKPQECILRCSQSNLACVQQEIQNINVVNGNQFIEITTTDVCPDPQSQVCVKKCEFTNDLCIFDSNNTEFICLTTIVDQKWELQLQQVTCLSVYFYTIAPMCKGFSYILFECKNIYSKAICLYMVRVPCMFDLLQGGCLPLQGNEHRIPDCSSISNIQQQSDNCEGYDDKCIYTNNSNKYYNSCKSSQSNNALCKNNIDESNVYDSQCSIISRIYKECVDIDLQSLFPNFPDYQCNQIPVDNASPILCAGASNYCRQVNQKCDNTEIQTSECQCDFSYSKSLCEFCGCNFNFLGRCQIKPLPPQLKQDQTNKYYLCYEVNQLQTTNENKKMACASVDQACKFSETCEDVTSFTCEQLNTSVVSLKACIRGEGRSVQYNTQRMICNLLSSTVQTCLNLNKQACLTKTRGVQCYWYNFQCLQNNNINDLTLFNNCLIINYDICQLLESNCQYDQDNNQCSYYDSNKGSCEQLFKEIHCKMSLIQSCQWNNQTQNCQKLDIKTPQCQDLNKYGCVSQNILACAWLDNELKCEQAIQNQNSDDCKHPVLNQNASHFSPLVCTSINAQQSCVQDQYYQCRQITFLDIINCNTIGINKFACVISTSGQCYWNGLKCDKNNDNTLGCQDILNLGACLNQLALCSFQQNKCQPYVVLSINDVLNNQILFPYSYSVCRAIDFQTTSSLVFNIDSNKCIDISLRIPYINNCGQYGLNFYACLQKTTSLCQYIYGNGCTSVSKLFLNNLNPNQDINLNWISCTYLIRKFQNLVCLPITDSDTCLILQNQNIIVNSLTCTSRIDQACQFNSATNTCQVITTNVSCTTNGLNKIGCIFYTKGSICQFINNFCVFNYDNTNCEDNINEDKCYSIKTQNQYCSFNQLNGCTKLNINQIQKCGYLENNQFKTNAFTCSVSIDVPCFYNMQTNYCSQYITPETNSKISINYGWSNSLSFNILTCQIYDIKKMMVRWSERCVEVQETELIFLKCNQYLNEIACLNVKTPFQYCKFENNQCIEQNLSDYINKNCESITKINNGVFCKMVQDVPCIYDSQTFSCKMVEDQIDCNDTCNQKACEKNQDNYIFKEICIKNVEKGISFCKDVAKQNNQVCSLIVSEGCIIQNEQCQAINENDYLTIKCDQAINLKGCLLIRTQQQNCQYLNGKCEYQQFQQIKNQSCLSYTNINSYVFCEVAEDVPCKFNLTKNICEQVDSKIEFECIRGINKLACLNNTSKSLQCDFFNYCYGPNSNFLNCIKNNKQNCCSEANTIESCLYQINQKCYWQNGCYLSEQIQQECSKIFNSSMQVCSEIKNEYCVLNPYSFNCEVIIPTSCDQMQTDDQCKRLRQFPCVWNKTSEICEFKDQTNYQSCQDISELNGNEKACTMVVKQGNFCIFDNNQCVTFTPMQDQNNCLPNINKISCLQQKYSLCEWVYYNQSFLLTQNSKEQKIQIGKCQNFTNFLKSTCHENLSYLSCIHITRPGYSCRWINSKCDKIIFKDSIIYSVLSFNIVNINACSLINDGTFAYYDQSNASCKEIIDMNEINCSQGLNKKACFQLNNKLCIWNEDQKLCQFQKESNTPIVNTCQLQGVNQELCQKLEVEKNCGYIYNDKNINSGCVEIDINEADCEYPGLNKHSCLNIKNFPCAWIRTQNESFSCQFYYPHTLCENIDLEVNSMVCKLVQPNPCFYNQQLNKCELFQVKNDSQCNIDGLNLLGCVQIQDCIFQDNQCQQFDKNYYYCEDVPYANENICKNASNNCKFSEINQGCLLSQSNEQCNTRGLSKLGCLQADKCQLVNDQCQCKNAQILYTNCNDILDQQTCDSIKFCYFESSFNQSISTQNAGTCKMRQCEQLNEQTCLSQILKQGICYLQKIQNITSCQKAATCEQIIQPTSDCLSYKIDQNICLGSGALQQCQTFQCNKLNQSECIKNSKFCQYENNNCVTLPCNLITDHQFCQIQNCDWQINQKCTRRTECGTYNSKNCYQKIYKLQQCAWITDIQSCTNQGCRYIPQQMDCNGVQIGKNLCVELEDNTCVACEEILDPCICLQQKDYCQYENKQCFSKICSLLQKETECDKMPHCIYNSEYGCFPNCEKIFIKQECKLYQVCDWENNLCSQVYNEEFFGTLPTRLYSNIISNLIIMLFVLEL